MFPRAHPAGIAWFALFGTLGLLTTVGACRTIATPHRPTETFPVGESDETQGNFPERIAQATADLLRKEPTGTLQTQKEVSDTAGAIRQRVEELDIDGANQTVAEIRFLAAEVRRRVEAWPDDLPQRITAEIENAHLDELSDYLASLLQCTEQRIAALDAEAFNAAADQLRGLASALTLKVEALDVAAGNALAVDVTSLKPDVEATVRRINALVVDLHTRVDAVPVSNVADTVRSLEGASADLRQLIALGRIVLAVAAVVLLLTGAGVVVRMRRAWP